MRDGEDLLDVNVLLGLAWPNHLFHATARDWFDKNRERGWATCSLTELGFIRLSANPKVFTDAVSPMEARLLLARLKKVGRHTFWQDDSEPTRLEANPSQKVVSHRQVTDGHLLDLARRRGGRLVTFDRGVSALLALNEGEERLLVLSDSR